MAYRCKTHYSQSQRIVLHQFRPCILALSDTVVDSGLSVQPVVAYRCNQPWQQSCGVEYPCNDSGLSLLFQWPIGVVSVEYRCRIRGLSV